MKTEFEFTRNNKLADVYTDSSTDFLLPDYNGNVKKLLYTSAELRPSGKFADGDSVEFSGIVVYDVIYLDSDDIISSVSFTSDYDYSVKCSSEKYKDSYADTKISNYSFRLNGPRKISAKASIVGSVKLTEADEISLGGTAFNGNYEPELDERVVKLQKTLVSQTKERDFAESIATLDGSAHEDVTVIFSHAESMCDSMEYSDGEINLKGRIRIIAVIKNDDEPLFTVEKFIPFEEMLVIENADEYMKFIPELAISSLTSNVNATENGCDVVVSVILELSVIGEGNYRQNMVVDSYLKSHQTENEYENFSYNEVENVFSTRLNHACELSKGELEAQGLREILFLTATPKIENTEFAEDSIIIRGEMKYQGVATEMREDDKVGYITLKHSAPFEISIPTECSECNLRFDTRVFTHSSSASFDLNNIYLSSVIDSYVTAINAGNEKILKSATVKDDSPIEANGSHITVYYPSESETLFEVAKKFHTSKSRIATNNLISQEVFADDNPKGKLLGVKKLIIM